MLQTIRVPKNLLFLSDKLPQPNYEKIGKKNHSFTKKIPNELPDINVKSSINGGSLPNLNTKISSESNSENSRTVSKKKYTSNTNRDAKEPAANLIDKLTVISEEFKDIKQAREKSPKHKKEIVRNQSPIKKIEYIDDNSNRKGSPTKNVYELPQIKGGKKTINMYYNINFKRVGC